MRCAVGCGHVQQPVENGYGIDVVRGDPAHPVNRGLACQRGIEQSADPDGEWLTRPLRREGEDLVPTSWGRAFEIAGTALAEAVDRSPDSVAVLGSGQQTNEAAYALGKVARGGIGTRYYDANTTLCMASAVTAYYEAFGSDAPPPTYDDIPDAETHLVWGANPAVAHPVMFRWIRESAEDGTMIVVDPVESETAALADRHVAPDPGTDLALARAVMARLVETDRIDRAFVEEYTDGFGELLDELPEPNAAAATAGVRTETVDAIAESLDRSTLIYWGMGVNQSTQGTDTARALIDLCLASGNLGPGAGPFSLTGQANSMGTRVCSSKGTWPGHRPFSDPDHRRTVADYWGVPVDRFPDDPGPGPVGIFDAVGEEIDVLWTVATNPAAGMPDAGSVHERLEEAFVIVQDAFRSETVEYADVVFPAATWGESEGTAMNMERTVSRVRAASDLPGSVRTDLELIVRLGEFVSPGLFGTRDPREIFEEFADLTAGTPADCSGIDYDRLEEEKAVRWPAPDGTSAGGYRYRVDDSADGTAEDADDTPASAPDGWRFETDSGRARFSAARHGGLPEPPDEAYPLLLTTARDSDRYNTGVRTREDGSVPHARVASATVEAFLGDHDDRLTAVDGGSTGTAPSSPPATTDLEARGVSTETNDTSPDGLDGRPIRVESRRGSIDARVAVDDSVPDGIVWLPIHDPAVNDLTLSEVDPRSKEPALKQCAVRLAPPTDGDT
jgi:assimilatory nitrate reductase catalytic subunit